MALPARPSEPDTRARVAHVGPDPATPGGMPAVVAGLLRSPLAERYAMEAIPSWRDSRPLPRLTLFGSSLAALARWCRGPGARIVHVHVAARGSLYRKALVVELAKLLGRPVVLQLHAGPGDLEAFFDRLGPLRRRAFARAFRRADRVLSVSDAGARVLRERLVDVPVEVVRNPPPQVDRGAGRRGEGDGVRILYLGGFADPAKGGAVLLEALPALLEAAPGARVDLAGPGELGDAAGGAALPEGARWLGLLGHDEKEAALAGADAFAMPSISEGFPVALLEAMAHGLAIVSTDVGGIGEVLTDGEDALLVAPGDAAALAERLAAVAGDAGLRRRLGEAALARAERLAADDVYAKLDAIYAELAAAQ